MTSLTAESFAPKVVAVPRSLVRLCAEAQRRLWGLRLGRLYGFGVGFSYAVMVFVGPESLATSAKLWGRALATASWVAGVGALTLATDLAARDAMQGLTGLARLRGFGEPQLERALGGAHGESWLAAQQLGGGEPAERVGGNVVAPVAERRQ